ncbi:serine/threonine protein kinase [Ktedonospora formicarum]|uniref:non-specific serine/threonine protein kinase n=1 Tax=Ktedonospora formicarum TaxID=2778364 RepID=A0A8J3HRV9_9CHLR|nr:serine/threonine-protein kinase [Ktedonospora formicarum]GHO42782.1 hypothetical protein KSX_09450 [Ktedonospora formicarum]
MDASKDPFLGRKIRGYRLEELCGRGSMTATYRARTRELWLCPEVLITIILVPHTLPRHIRRKFSERFERKGEQLITLRHTHLFPLYGYGEQEGVFYHVLPLFSGETLASRLRQQKPWTPQEVLTVLNPVADLLDFIHEQGQAYQYLNPNDVLILQNAEVQLIDFGLMQILSKKGLEEGSSSNSSYEHLKSVTDNFMSPPEYLAPEIIRGADGDFRSDIYSLGIMLFEMLSGRPPFTGGNYVEIARKHIFEPLPSLHEIAPHIPVALELVINHALHRSPERRFQSARALVTAYTHVLNDRLYAPKQVYISQAIEKIRTLAGPSTPSPMQLSAPQPSSNVVSGKLNPMHAQTVYGASGDDFTHLSATQEQPALVRGVYTPPPQPALESPVIPSPQEPILQQDFPEPVSPYQQEMQATPVSPRLPYQEDVPDETLLLQWVSSPNARNLHKISRLCRNKPGATPQLPERMKSKPSSGGLL